MDASVGRIEQHFANALSENGEVKVVDAFHYPYTERGVDELALLARAFFEQNILPEEGAMLDQDLALVADLYQYQRLLSYYTRAKERGGFPRKVPPLKLSTADEL